MSILGTILLIFGLSQLYWLWTARSWVKKTIPTTRGRVLAATLGLAFYLFLFAFNFGLVGNPRTSIYLTWSEVLFAAPFLWWVAASIVGFLLVLILTAIKGAGRVAGIAPSPERRRFLEQTGTVITSAPFVAGAYGLLYGRLNLETTRQPIRMAHLPKAFEGFRIAQLSDIHIGPFMPSDQIRKYVAIANQLKPDLIVLTGDFVTWDPYTQKPVVEALSGVRAPFGIFGCLGNHDAWAGVEDSIAQLFRHVGVRILRQERVEIARGGESLHLIGVDFQSRRQIGPTSPTLHILGGVDRLMVPGEVNILLSHNPDTFDRAAELGVDLSLAGHTHGGQVALEFINPQLAPSRIVTPYVSGWFQKNGSQLYVNRGIGTIGVPIRLGAPPEITVYELQRG